MDESQEDQRTPHRQRPNRAVSLEQLRRLGVVYRRVGRGLVPPGTAGVIPLGTAGGAEGVVAVVPQGMTRVGTAGYGRVGTAGYGGEPRVGLSCAGRAWPGRAARREEAAGADAGRVQAPRVLVAAPPAAAEPPRHCRHLGIPTST